MHPAQAQHPRGSLIARVALLTLATLVAACGDRSGDRDEEGRPAGPDTAVALDPAPAVEPSTLPATVRRLPPDSFASVPDTVRAALRDAGCVVPQTAARDDAHNVVRGELAAPGQTDWAALCARGDSTGITVVWGGPARCDTPLAWRPNDAHLQPGPGPDDDPEFARTLGVANMVAILRRAQALEAPEPPTRDHAGLEDTRVGKPSIVRFCHDGQWRELFGAD